MEFLRRNWIRGCVKVEFLRRNWIFQLPEVKFLPQYSIRGCRESSFALFYKVYNLHKPLRCFFLGLSVNHVQAGKNEGISIYDL